MIPGVLRLELLHSRQFRGPSQRPSIRFDGPGFRGDLDHRRRPESRWTSRLAPRERVHRNLRDTICRRIACRALFEALDVPSFTRDIRRFGSTVDRVSNLRKRLLFQCRASAELWTTNRPDARLARSLHEEHPKKKLSGQPTGEAGCCSQSSVSVNIWAIAPAHRSRRVPEFNANTDRRGHDRRCNLAVDADQPLGSRYVGFESPTEESAWLVDRLTGTVYKCQAAASRQRLLRGRDRHRQRRGAARSAVTVGQPLIRGTPHVGESDYIAARCPARPTPVP